MLRTWLLLFACAALAGCQSVPLNPSAPAPREDVRLFGREVPARPESIQDIVRDHVARGMTLPHAEKILNDAGFACRKEDFTALFAPCAAPEIPQPAHHTKGLTAVYCTTRRDILGRWGREYETVLVVLGVDRARTVQTVETLAARKPHPRASFFNEHPDLDEPTGVPLPEAIARMEANGFRCKSAGPGCTLCEASSEWALGGKIVRVKLLTDRAGSVCDSEVPRQGETFDAERCMLPSDEDSTAKAVCKVALFPVREVTRIAAITTLVSVGVTLMCLAHP